MSEIRIGTRREWEDARRSLLEREKELTRMADALAVERRALPWVPVERSYTFTTERGPRTLAELFDGRSQLLVQHFMYAPEWDEGCVGCSALADEIDLPRVHLEHHDVTFVAISRAPLEQLLAYRARMGWTFPWASSAGSDFNFDFDASVETPDGIAERSGMSAFALRDGTVYHTYSTFSRGMDVVWGMYQWLDRAPLGRNEGDDDWIRRHDAYEVAVA